MQLLQDPEYQFISLCCLIRAHINLGNFDEAERNIPKLKEYGNTSNLSLLFTIKLLHKQVKLQETLKIFESCNNCDMFEWWMEMGDVYWDLQLFDKSLVPYLKVKNYYFICCE